MGCIQYYLIRENDIAYHYHRPKYDGVYSQKSVAFLVGIQEDC